MQSQQAHTSLSRTRISSLPSGCWSPRPAAAAAAAAAAPDSVGLRGTGPAADWARLRRGLCLAEAVLASRGPSRWVLPAPRNLPCRSHSPGMEGKDGALAGEPSLGRPVPPGRQKALQILHGSAKICRKRDAQEAEFTMFICTEM